VLWTGEADTGRPVGDPTVQIALVAVSVSMDMM
jgi:hypothetical protein